MIDVKEWMKQFEEEFGTTAGLQEENEEQGETLADVINDMLDAYMEECVEHFLAARSRSMEDDGRYFYSKKELETFKDGYLSHGGDLDKLHIGVVYCDDGEFLCYEVCRKIYYNAETHYAKKQLYDENGNRKQIFFS